MLNLHFKHPAKAPPDLADKPISVKWLIAEQKVEADPSGPQIPSPSPPILWLGEAQPCATSLPVCPLLHQAQSTSQSSTGSCASSLPCMEILRTRQLVLVVLLWSFFPSLYLTSQRERCWPKLNTPFQERKYHYTGIMSERYPSAVLN